MNFVIFSFWSHFNKCSIPNCNSEKSSKGTQVTASSPTWGCFFFEKTFYWHNELQFDVKFIQFLRNVYIWQRSPIADSVCHDIRDTLHLKWSSQQSLSFTVSAARKPYFNDVLEGSQLAVTFIRLQCANYSSWPSTTNILHHKPPVKKHFVLFMTANVIAIWRPSKSCNSLHFLSQVLPSQAFIPCVLKL